MKSDMYFSMASYVLLKVKIMYYKLWRFMAVVVDSSKAVYGGNGSIGLIHFKFFALPFPKIMNTPGPQTQGPGLMMTRKELASLENTNGNGNANVILSIQVMK